MNSRTTVVAVVVLVVLGAGLGAAVFAGVGPFDPSGGEDDIGSFPTATSGGSGSGGGGDGGGGGGDGGGSDDGQSTPPFTFRVTDTQKCGQTCRDVTVKLTNNMDQPANDVDVYVRIFAGNTTNADARVWQAREDLGQVGAGETVRRTKRVKLSLMEGFRVQQNGGWITIQTTVQSANETQTFTERRDVT